MSLRYFKLGIQLYRQKEQRPPYGANINLFCPECGNFWGCVYYVDAPRSRGPQWIAEPSLCRSCEGGEFFHYSDRLDESWRSLRQWRNFPYEVLLRELLLIAEKFDHGHPIMNGLINPKEL